MFWIRVKQITAKDAKSLKDEQNALMVDVRKPKDYEVSHVDGAIHANIKEVQEVIDQEERSRPIICYCYMGISSRLACKNLRKAGFTNVLNLKGGYDAWKKTWPDAGGDKT
jgi:thiosulfate sulfurtransferase